jgi:hypothetical protein
VGELAAMVPVGGAWGGRAQGFAAAGCAAGAEVTAVELVDAVDVERSADGEAVEDPPPHPAMATVTASASSAAGAVAPGARRGAPFIPAVRR